VLCSDGWPAGTEKFSKGSSVVILYSKIGNELTFVILFECCVVMGHLQVQRYSQKKVAL